MHELSRRFDELTRDPRLLGIARQLLGGDVYLHQSRINDKLSFQGSGFNWHSDFETWHAEDGMPAMRALSASLMLTDNNEFNGPLMLIPGPKGPPGSLLLFECNTLHASNANISPWPRANLFFVYNSADNALRDPYCGNDPRPGFLATRGAAQPLAMHDQPIRWEVA